MAAAKTPGFREKVHDPSQYVALFGLVPPPEKVEKEKIVTAAKATADSLKDLPLDGLIVYDIQDEKGRVPGEERPFPFSKTHEPRWYASLLSQQTGFQSIVYRAVADHPAKEMDSWLETTWREFDVQNMVLVGGSCSSIEYPGFKTVPEAAAFIKAKNSEYILGGITIPERHRDKGDEHKRINTKVGEGLSFFTSQVVYNVDNAICLLKDYDSIIKSENIAKPARLIFTFAPFGRKSTVTFLKWLGVELPHGTERRVLSRENLQRRLDESIEICVENMRRILDVVERCDIKVPLGFAVESVSKFKDEHKGAVRLFSLLKKQMEEFFATPVREATAKVEAEISAQPLSAVITVRDDPTLKSSAEDGFWYF